MGAANGIDQVPTTAENTDFNFSDNPLDLSTIEPLLDEDGNPVLDDDGNALDIYGNPIVKPDVDVSSGTTNDGTVETNDGTVDFSKTRFNKDDFTALLL